MGPAQTAEGRTATSGPWTPRIALQLAVLAAAAFTYVTAELLPVGALPAIARDLHVSVPMVGTLLAWYALVAAVTTIPLVRWTAHWPRRRALLLSLSCLTVSQLISALAPNFVVLAGGRALSAVTHGLMLSVIAPIATRLVPASHSGRATTSIYVGISLAVVVGSPATAAMSLAWGWRDRRKRGSGHRRRRHYRGRRCAAGAVAERRSAAPGPVGPPGTTATAG